MSIKPRSVSCDSVNCNNSYTEPVYGEGLPNWGQLRGARNENNEEPWLCPKCMVNHIKIINGEDK